MDSPLWAEIYRRGDTFSFVNNSITPESSESAGNVYGDPELDAVAQILFASMLDRLKTPIEILSIFVVDVVTSVQQGCLEWLAIDANTGKRLSFNLITFHIHIFKSTPFYT